MTGRFHPSTTQEEARALTAACLQAIATGWPVVFFKLSAVHGVNGQQASAEPDIPAMISAAADMACQLTNAVDHRMQIEGPNEPV